MWTKFLLVIASAVEIGKTVIAGNSASANLHTDIIRSSGTGTLTTVVPQFVMLSSECCMFEVTVVEAKGVAYIGWIDANWRDKDCKGIGADINSWSVCGHRSDSGRSIVIGLNLSALPFGDMMSSPALLILTSALMFYHNGKNMDQGMGSIEFPKFLTPAVSFESGFQFHLNLGRRPFSWVPTIGKKHIRSVHHWQFQVVSAYVSETQRARFARLLAFTFKECYCKFYKGKPLARVKGHWWSRHNMLLDVDSIRKSTTWKCVCTGVNGTLQALGASRRPMMPCSTGRAT